MGGMNDELITINLREWLDMKSRAERAETERYVLYMLARTMYSSEYIQDSIDSALKEPRT